MDDPQTGVHNELFAEDYLKLDPCDQLLHQQCRQLTVILMDLKRSDDLDPREQKGLLLGQPYSGVMPKFYGLLKVHKIGTLKLRPIISNSGLYLDNVMLKLKSILNLLLWGSMSLANSYELVQLLRDYNFGSQDILLSFDAASLFTPFPVKDPLSIVEQRLKDLRELPENPIGEITSLSNYAIMKLLGHVLNQCYFTWDSSLYKQTSGLPMGGRLSPILANLYMEQLTTRCYAQLPLSPKHILDMWTIFSSFGI